MNLSRYCETIGNILKYILGNIPQDSFGKDIPKPQKSTADVILLDEGSHAQS